MANGATRYGKTFGVTPANGEVIRHVPDGGHEDTLAAIDAADRAFASWSNTSALSGRDLNKATS